MREEYEGYELEDGETISGNRMITFRVSLDGGLCMITWDRTKERYVRMISLMLTGGALTVFSKFSPDPIYCLLVMSELKK